MSQLEACPVRDAQPTRDPTPPASPPEARPHLLFLDGIRGLAALYVAIFHASSFAGSETVSPPLRALANCFHFGHLAVGVFIVLSGFCLMLPVAAAGNGRLPRGLADYLRRRAWRILPPYYAALALSIACLSVGLLFTGASVVQGQEIRSGLSVGSVISHLLLLHNLKVDWAYTINGPLWTVATEWQIYFLFPLILLPVWRRFGSAAAVAVGFCLGLAPVFLLPDKQSFWWAGPWYLGLFALGTAVADHSFSPGKPRRGPHTSARAGLLFTSVLIMLCNLPPRTVPLWGLDVAIGFATASVTAYCVDQAHARPASKGSPLLRLLQAGPVAGLGAFSYSLYVIHHPIQRGMLRVLQTLGLSVDLIFCIQLFIGMPLIVGLAYLFHRAFERPFIRQRRGAAKRKSAPATAT
ncbi:MAG: acyltransferase family protein [Actinomycetota bacterium]